VVWPPVQFLMSGRNFYVFSCSEGSGSGDDESGSDRSPPPAKGRKTPAAKAPPTKSKKPAADHKSSKKTVSSQDVQASVTGKKLGKLRLFAKEKTPEPDIGEMKGLIADLKGQILGLEEEHEEYVQKCHDAAKRLAKALEQMRLDDEDLDMVKSALLDARFPFLEEPEEV